MDIITINWEFFAVNNNSQLTQRTKSKTCEIFSTTDYYNITSTMDYLKN